LYAVAGERELLRSTRRIFDKDALVILIVISIHLIIFLTAGLYQRVTPILPTRDVITLDLLENSKSQHASSRIKQALDLSLDPKDTKDTKVSVSLSSVATSSSPIASPFSLRSQGIQARNQLANPKPPYPLVSRRMGEQGAVDLRLCLTYQGQIESVSVIKSSGYKRLDNSALETVKTWKFSPLEMVEASSSDCYRLPIYFKLEA
jgi:TonB family protein